MLEGLLKKCRALFDLASFGKGIDDTHIKDPVLGPSDGFSFPGVEKYSRAFGA